MLAKALDVGEQQLCCLEQLLALIGQLKSAAAAPAQGVAQALLKVPDHHAQSRQAGVEPCLGCGEPAGINDGAEHPQHPQINIGKASQHGRSLKLA